MSQVPLFAAIFCVGLAVMLGLGPRGQLQLVAALAFPIGLATTVVAVLVLLALGGRYDATGIAVAMAIPTAGGVIALRRRGVEPGTVPRVLGWGLGFVAMCCVASSTNLTLMTHDSHHFVAFARAVAADHALDATVLGKLRAYGVFQVVVQSLHQATREDFLYAAPPVLGASFVGVFVTTLAAAAQTLGARGRRVPFTIALVTLALFSLFMMVRHTFYIHTNFAAAAYLFSFVTLFWLAEVNNDATFLPAAFIALTGFTLQRVETPVFACVFMVFTVLMTRQPRASVTPPLAIYTAVITSWYMVLSAYVPADQSFLTPTRARLVAVGVLAFFGYWLAGRHRWVVAINRRAPALFAGAIALLLAALFALKTRHMLASVEALARNLTALPYWGWSWFFIVALVAVAFRMPSPPRRGAFAFGIPATLAVMVMLSAGRKPYRFSVNDSANRMMVHLLPLIFFYLGLKLLTTQARAQRSQGALSGK